jgi:hypothetical protein
MPAVRRIIRDAATHGYRMSAFLTGIVESPAFWSARTRRDSAATAATSSRER